MGQVLRACVIGDEHPEVRGYLAIRDALRHAAVALAIELETEWLPTASLELAVEEQLATFDGLWCGPWGPYANAEGASRAIRFARDAHVPFLGTCAGFQQAVIEFARTVLGIADADHAESNPAAATPVIARLSHPLRERSAAVVLDPASRSARIYKRTMIAEHYRCEFGLHPGYLSQLHRGGLRVTGVDEIGLATVVEYPPHPFFVATLFLPEHASRAGTPHPLVSEFVECMATARAMRA